MKLNLPFINSVSSLDKILFAKNLSLMIKAGLPLRDALATIKEQSKSRNFKNVLGDIIKNIDNGQSLALSLSGHPQAFNSFYVNIIKTGEESGTLEENLRYLALQLEKASRLQRKVWAAMLYPLIVLTALTLLSAALLFFVLPKIVPVFKGLDVQLPLSTRILIGFAELVQNQGVFILAALVGLIVISILISRIPSVRFFNHRLVLKLPVAGSIVRDVNLAHFSRALSILLKSGIPAIEALAITRASLNNLVYQKELSEAADSLKKGKTISSCFRKKEAVFPLMVSRMIGVGEKTGNLEETLAYLSNFYEQEVDRATKNISVVLEPILLLIVGAAVGFIALAIISPIYEITQGLHF